MNKVYEVVEELAVTRCWCGLQHAVPKSLFDMQKRQYRDGEAQQGICCPLGHMWTFSGISKAERLDGQLKKERFEADRRLQREIAGHDQTRAELRTTEASRRGEKAAKTRIKNRVSKGVCPCCTRSFTNLQRHMASQHPDYTEQDTPQ